MFIDGLDEFEGPFDTVIDMIKDLADQTHVKVCASSRPLLTFEEAFIEKPSLRLQDLTFDSMRNYAAVKLSDQIQKYISVNKYELTQTGDLIDRIVERAEGIFLWAVIAIRGLREGLRGIASFPELAKTIEALPLELESLFMLMLNNIKPVFKRDAAKFLEMTLYGNKYGLWDLCTFHLSHSQSELSDAPFLYDELNTKDLIRDCRILETRLKSHTTGLLELTPTDQGDDIYCERKDLDPVLFTRVSFLHRAVRDFLLNNDHAKSFLAYNGSSEAQSHLSIARGVVAQLAHFSRGDSRYVSRYVGDERPNPVYSPFMEILEQIVMVESILGVPQTRLMQSLDYEVFARGYSVVDKSHHMSEFLPSFWKTESGTVIDQVGMAAAVGMKFYVCEQLDLSVEPRSYPCNLPNLSNYSIRKQTISTLFWRRPQQSPSLDTKLVVGSHCSSYREALGGCLLWEVDLDPKLSSRTQITSEKYLLAESFLLSCCHPHNPTYHDLAQILLRAGGNPMVQVKPEGGSMLQSESFWEKWLKNLNRLRRKYLVADDRSEGIMFRHGDDMHSTLKETFEITKALLAHGANVNFQISLLPLRRLEPIFFRGQFSLRLKVTAMFILEECYNTEPEFRRFASEIESLVEKPTRIVEVIHEKYGYQGANTSTITHLKPEESEMLWPLIEKGEETGRDEDWEALEAAFESVWIAQDPGFN